MAIWYVELKKDTYFPYEVEAPDAETAQDKALKAAPGDPRDWKIVETSIVERLGKHVEEGAAKIL